MSVIGMKKAKQKVNFSWDIISIIVIIISDEFYAAVSPHYVQEMFTHIC